MIQYDSKNGFLNLQQRVNKITKKYANVLRVIKDKL